ncbi:MAG: hypothetical protein HY327_11645, partial [Chloroflexi bacterium]|nr:hypothetical protein [Chloroflexota bacterium]
MRSEKNLVTMATLVILTTLIVMISCAPATTPPPVKETVVVKETVIVQPPAAPKPTEAPKPTLAPGPRLKLQSPAEGSMIEIVGVASQANLSLEPNAITATIKYITDTKVGEVSAVRGLPVAGSVNHPVNVPVHLALKVADPKNPPKTVRWAVSGPAGTKAAIKDSAAVKTEFTPDVVGVYLVTVTATDAANASKNAGIQIHAGTYIGVNDGNCKTCHATQTDEWAKTNHATLFARELDNLVDGPQKIDTHYSDSCATCHTIGFNPPPYAGSGGYYDVKTKTGWKFPTWDLINGAFAKKNPSNWETAPAAIKNMASISCENCHGPAKEHVTQGAAVMTASLDNKVCDQCHGAAANHSRGWQTANSKHTTGTSFEEINGPARQACMRCHGGEGFITFLAKPKEQAAWSNEPGYIGCATCHEPHSDANYAQLRVVGKPVEVPFEVKNDVGLSAICFTCHNSRVNSADFEAGKSTSTPHYSAAAEMLSGIGGITYGQTLPNSTEHLKVGNAPIKNTAYDGKNLSLPQFLFSKPLDTKGNTPGPCVTCHMWAPV